MSLHDLTRPYDPCEHSHAENVVNGRKGGLSGGAMRTMVAERAWVKWDGLWVAGWTQEAIGKLVGVTQQAVSYGIRRIREIRRERELERNPQRGGPVMPPPLTSGAQSDPERDPKGEPSKPETNGGWADGRPSGGVIGLWLWLKRHRRRKPSWSPGCIEWSNG